MIGAIIGDIAGSRFEFNNHKSKSFELLSKECRVTDDSIMTLAVAKAILEADKMAGNAKNNSDSLEHNSSNESRVEQANGRETHHVKGSEIKHVNGSVCVHRSGEDDKPSAGQGEPNAGQEYYNLLEKMAVKYMQEIGRKYPDCGYGGRFKEWLFSDNPQPYNSFGNGAAMRISPVGFMAPSEEEVCKLSKAITGVTHNHEEGLKGAEATAMAIFMARSGCTKNAIRDKIARDYYSLDFTLEEIRATYEFDVTCQGSVPQAMVAFLESTSFEDAIRNAI
ncbi:MAG: ADP-ribosylglycohydrolase [Desulfitobacterium sp.]|nr:ADP-ribosylglycohydrolase [Desulfitobacterium sp.]